MQVKVGHYYSRKTCVGENKYMYSSKFSFSNFFCCISVLMVPTRSGSRGLSRHVCIVLSLESYLFLEVVCKIYVQIYSQTFIT